VQLHLGSVRVVGAVDVPRFGEERVSLLEVRRESCYERRVSVDG